MKHIDKDFVHSTENFVKVSILVTDLLNLLLGLLAIKYRRVARYTIFVMIVGNAVNSMVPMQAGTSVYPADKKMVTFSVYINGVCVPEVDVILCFFSDLVI